MLSMECCLFIVYLFVFAGSFSQILIVETLVYMHHVTIILLLQPLIRMNFVHCASVALTGLVV